MVFTIVVEDTSPLGLLEKRLKRFLTDQPVNIEAERKQCAFRGKP
jgi:hypothetical protein